jgi:CheY-like chemotaxis protein
MEDLPAPSGSDNCRPVLDLLKTLLENEGGSLGMPGVLAELARAFAASNAGLTLSERGPAITAAPWREPLTPTEAEFFARTRCVVSALTHRSPGRSLLASAVHMAGLPRCVLWVEDGPQREWTAGESAALALAAQVVGRLAVTKPGSSWAGILERAEFQGRFDEASIIARRLAHDYGNILTCILGFSELGVSLVQRNSPLYRYLEEVHRGAQQGAELTHRLRLFARRPEPPTGGTSLLAAINEVRSRLVETFPRAWGEFTVPGDVPVLVGPEHLQELLTSLLTNACEATDGQGPVSLSVQMASLTAEDCVGLIGNASPGDFVEVVVADRGPGLSPAARQHLFRDVFFSDKPRHRGLGLAIVTGVVLGYRGGFRLDSPPEGGVLARVWLPVEPVAIRQTLPDTWPTVETPSILVVDDDPAVVRLVRTTLEQSGFLVETAGDGEEALRLFELTPRRFRLVVTDLLMPRMDGLELARRLRQQDPGLRLLLMSGQMPAETARQRLAGADFAFLDKPFRPEGLLRAVRTVLAQPSRPGVAEPTPARVLQAPGAMP